MTGMLELREKERAPIRSEREIGDLEHNLTPIISFWNGHRISSPALKCHVHLTKI